MLVPLWLSSVLSSSRPLSLVLRRKALTPIQVQPQLKLYLRFSCVLVSRAVHDTQNSDSKSHYSQHHVTLGGSICVGLLGVVGYSMFVNQNVKGDFVMICEQNAMQSTLMFILLLPILASNEAAGWLEVFADVSESGRTSTMVAYSLGLFFARPLTLFSCIGVMAFASASLVGTLGGPRRLLVIILAFIIFNESASAPKLVSVACLCVALGIYAYGGHRLQLEKEKEENKTQPKVARGSV